MKDVLAINLRPILIASSGAGLLSGLAGMVAGYTDLPRWAWVASTVPVIAALALEIVSSLRRGDVGLDIVALLSMGSALLFGEYLAACVVAVMYAGGQYLEGFAVQGAGRR